MRQSIYKLSLISLTIVTVTLSNVSLNATAQTLKVAQISEEVGFSSTKLKLLSKDIQQLVRINNVWQFSFFTT